MLKKPFFILLTLMFSIAAIAVADKSYSDGLINGTYKIKIEDRYHHLGDDDMNVFLVREDEGTYWETTFWLKKQVLEDSEIAFVKFLAHHVDLADLIVNGDYRRRLHDTHSPGDPEQLLFTYVLRLPLNILNKGENTIGIEVGDFGEESYDDMEFGELEIWFQ